MIVVDDMFSNNKLCSGCTACYHSCAQHAISLVPDKLGLPRPHVENKLCNNCGVCEIVCPFIHPNIEKYCLFEKSLRYCATHTSKDVLLQSQSGGVFTALSDVILKNKGIVYGCKLNDNFEAVHGRAETTSERDYFRGSKYVLSDMNAVFLNVKEDLLSGRNVLFSGTPCQVSGLKNYLRNFDTHNLICVDILCHGVTSPQIWRDFLDYSLRKHHGNKITQANFRYKKINGWYDHLEQISVDDNAYESRIYASLFYSHDFFPSGCISCPFRGEKRVGDLSIGDFWYVKKTFPDYDDSLGVSIILINSQIGLDLFNISKSELNIKETKFESGIQSRLMMGGVSYSTYHKLLLIIYHICRIRILRRFGLFIRIWEYIFIDKK